MTKPSDFIFNSDYLALAETSRNKFFVSIPPMSYTQYQGWDFPISYSVDLNCQATTGAIDQFQLEYNGNTFYGDQIIYPAYEISSGVYSNNWTLSVFRKNANQITVMVYFFPQAEVTGTTTPQITLNISVCSFKPPNVF